MSLRCLLGWHTSVYTDGAIRCRRCDRVLDSWVVWRPEIAIRQAREQERVDAADRALHVEREARAAAMAEAQPARGRLRMVGRG